MWHPDSLIHFGRKLDFRDLGVSLSLEFVQFFFLRRSLRYSGSRILASLISGSGLALIAAAPPLARLLRASTSINLVSAINSAGAIARRLAGPTSAAPADGRHSVLPQSVPVHRPIARVRDPHTWVLARINSARAMTIRIAELTQAFLRILGIFNTHQHQVSAMPYT